MKHLHLFCKWCFYASFRCVYSVLTSRHHQRLAFRALRKSELFCEAIGSINSKFWKVLFLPCFVISSETECFTYVLYLFSYPCRTTPHCSPPHRDSRHLLCQISGSDHVCIVAFCTDWRVLPAGCTGHHENPPGIHNGTTACPLEYISHGHTCAKRMKELEDHMYAVRSAYFTTRTRLTCCPDRGSLKAGHSVARSIRAGSGIRDPWRCWVGRCHGGSISFGRAHIRAPRQVSSGFWWSLVAHYWCKGSECNRGNWSRFVSATHEEQWGGRWPACLIERENVVRAVLGRGQWHTCSRTLISYG